VLESNATLEAQKVSDLPAWLVRVWTHHGKGREIIVDMGLWLPEYPDLLRLIEAYSGVDAYPHRDCLLPDGITPAACEITIKPRTLEALRALPTGKPGPKTNRTQVTVDGKAYDTRNERVFIALHATPEALNETLPLLIIQFEGETELRVRRAISAKLWTILTLRHNDINPDLRSKIGRLYAEAWQPGAS
jgi:hypothetical protein